MVEVEGGVGGPEERRGDRWEVGASVGVQVLKGLGLKVLGSRNGFRVTAEGCPWVVFLARVDLNFWCLSGWAGWAGRAETWALDRAGRICLGPKSGLDRGWAEGVGPSKRIAGALDRAACADVMGGRGLGGEDPGEAGGLWLGGSVVRREKPDESGRGAMWAVAGELSSDAPTAVAGGARACRSSARLAAKNKTSSVDAAIARKARDLDPISPGRGGRATVRDSRLQKLGRLCGVRLSAAEANSLRDFVSHDV